MDNYSKIYWLTRLDGLHGILIALTVIAFVAVVAIVLGTLISADFDEFYDDDKVEKRKALRDKFTPKIKWLIPLGFFCLFASVMIPTENEAIKIIVGGKTLNYCESDSSLTKIPGQTTAIVSEYLDKTLKELKSSK